MKGVSCEKICVWDRIYVNFELLNQF